MKNSARFDAAVSIIRPLSVALADRIASKREAVLTGFGTVKTAEKETKGGISYGSASASKAAKWAGLSAEDASAFASAWAVSVAVDAAIMAPLNAK